MTDELEPEETAQERAERHWTRTPERMAELTRRRMEKVAAGDERARGGRRRKGKLSDDELRAEVLKHAAEELIPYRAKAILKIGAMLDSKDPGDVKFAAKTILEYTDGKPTQPVTTRQDGPVEVVYRTSALPGAFVPQALEQDDEAADSG